MSNFDTLYETKLLERLTFLEKYRKKARLQIALLGFIGITFFIVYIKLILTYDNENYAFFLLPGLFFLGFSWAIASISGNKIQLLFKKEIILPILNDLSEDVSYYPKKKIKTNAFNKSQLFKFHVDDNIGNDYIKCSKNGNILQIFEIRVFKYLGFKVFFSGIFMVANFNKSFKTKTIVIPESRNDILEKFKLKFSGNMKSPSIIKLEDPNFSNKFTVISEDHIESRYLLSTSMMQRLYDYDEKYKHIAAFSFIDNDLYVSIPIKRDLFEPRYYKSNVDKSFIREYYNFYKSFVDIIEDLDLNNDIWL